MKSKAFVILFILLLTFIFYWFQVKPSNDRQRELESQLEQLQKQVKSQDRDYYDNSGNIDDLKNQVEELEYSMEQAERDAEDEINNMNNCERNGGRWQGNGLCIYY